MHEMAIARNLLEIILQESQAHGVSRVVSVSLKVGELSAVVPESLRFCFEIIAEGTVAEGAQLEIERVLVKCSCRECERDFEVSNLVFKCPRCGSTSVEILSGKELSLESFEAE